MTKQSCSAAKSYDDIGRLYAQRRRTDSRIGHAIWSALGPERTVLDVGAGTGSYEPTDRAVLAVQPSAVMIAQRPPGAPPVLMATAGALPIEDGSFDAAMTVLNLHHWSDPASGLAEMRRVARRLVVLTFGPEINNRCWLLDDLLDLDAVDGGYRLLVAE